MFIQGELNVNEMIRYRSTVNGTAESSQKKKCIKWRGKPNINKLQNADIHIKCIESE